MIEDEIRSILKSLLERSKAKRINWTEFEGPLALGHDDYVVSFPKSSVNVFRDSEGVMHATILNSAGATVGSISSNESLEDSELLGDLLESARESVFMVDETLEDLRRALAGKQAMGETANRPITEDDIPF